ncbi:anaphase-promoting complex, cyclosome, subunit 4-domain-containing protein [Syncephalis plumigaleata]|nr:anaphase-promoting complex, cyclosome, subunit 4-domain-containing protein [Syncephalis plumigaleata]
MDRQRDDVTFLIGSFTPPITDLESVAVYDSVSETDEPPEEEEQQSRHRVKRQRRTAKAMSIKSVKEQSPLSLERRVSANIALSTLKPVHPDTARHFHLYSERSLADPVQLASWCPTMDILAIAHSRGDLTVSRISWSRAWTLPAESNSSQITCINWRPDGRLLAVGYADGSVKLLHSFDGKLVHKIEPLVDTSSTNIEDANNSLNTRSTCLPTSSIVGLNWMTKLATEAIPDRERLKMLDILRDRSVSSNCPVEHPNTIRKPDVQTKRAINTSMHSDDLSTSPYGLLAIVDAGGWTRLSFNGLLDIGVVGYDRPQGVLSVYIDEETLSYLLLLTIRTTDTGRVIELQQFSLHYIGKYASELSVIESLSTNTNRLLNEINDACRLLKNEYHNYRQSIDEQVHSLASLLWRHGDDCTPHGAFLYFMATLSFNGVFEQYFEQNLTENHIKRWRSTGQKSLGTMQETIEEKLLPAVKELEQITYKVKTFTLWNERYGPLGFKTTDIQQGQASIDRFISQIISLSKNIRNEIDCFNEFITWLEFASITMTTGKQYKEHRPIQIKQELVQTFMKQSLAGEQYIRDNEDVADSDEDPFHEVLRGTDQLYSFFHKVKSKNNKLTHRFNKITGLMRKIFNSSMDTINDNIELVSALTIAQPGNDTNTICTMRVVINEKDKQHYCYVAYYCNSSLNEAEHSSSDNDMTLTDAGKYH